MYICVDLYLTHEVVLIEVVRVWFSCGWLFKEEVDP
jgi:hypothetical protein